MRPLAGAMRTPVSEGPLPGCRLVATPRRGDEDLRTGRRPTVRWRCVATPRRGDEDRRSQQPRTPRRVATPRRGDEDPTVKPLVARGGADGFRCCFSADLRLCGRARCVAEIWRYGDVKEQGGVTDIGGVSWAPQSGLNFFRFDGQLGRFRASRAPLRGDEADIAGLVQRKYSQLRPLGGQADAACSTS